MAEHLQKGSCCSPSHNLQLLKHLFCLAVYWRLDNTFHYCALYALFSVQQRINWPACCQIQLRACRAERRVENEMVPQLFDVLHCR